MWARVLIWRIFAFLAISSLTTTDASGEQKISITESNVAPSHTPGELIFSDEFNSLDLETWMHENTLGTKNWEFQMYTNSRYNSYAQNGVLAIKPTLTSDEKGEDFLGNGLWFIEGPFPDDMCTDSTNYGCKRPGQYPNLLNPVVSAKIKTAESFYFKYGRVEVRAKVPGGDWMWSTIGMSPRFNGYGMSPSSGEIFIIESRGNQKLFDAKSGRNVGSEMVSSSLHFGPQWPVDGWEKARHETVVSTLGRGFDQDFHLYGINWTDKYIEFTLDGNVTRKIEPSEDGFWEIGEFDNSYPNPWEHAANKPLAPFDQKFYLTVSVAVGSGTYFSDEWKNEKGEKPWKNDSPVPILKFYQAKKDWFPTWKGDAGQLQIDYIRVYAI